MDLAQLVIAIGGLALAGAAWVAFTADDHRRGSSAWKLIGVGLFAMALRSAWALFQINRGSAKPDSVDEAMLTAAAIAIAIGVYVYFRERDEQAIDHGPEESADQRLRDFAVVASDWFWECDENFRFTYFSDRIEEVTGVPASFHIGKTREELVAEGIGELNAEWSQHLETLKAHKPFKDYRFERQDKDGRVHHLSASGQPRFSADNVFLGYRGIGRDITNEWEASETQKRLAAAIEALKDGVALYDQNDRLLMCNQSYKDMSGEIGKHFVPGMSFAEQLRLAAESGFVLDANEDNEKWVRQRLTQRENPGITFEQQRLHNRWVAIRDQRLPEGDVVTIVSDITQAKVIEDALKLGESRLKDFAETAADWFWEQDAELKFTFVSAENSDITGMKAHEHYGKTRRETNIEVEDEKDLVAHEEQLKRREAFEDFRFSRLSPTGKRAYLTVSGKPFYDENGTFAGYRGAGHDITDAINSEKAFQEERDKAQAANRAKTTFLANMSHELRTPLNAIIGFADVISQEMVGSIGSREYVDYADHIKQSGLDLLDVINAVLDLAKVEAGKLKIDDTDVVVTGLLYSIAEMFRKTADDLGVSIHVTPPDQDLLIRIDERLLRQVLYNIVSNAVKFAGDVGEVELSAEINDGGVTFLVVDNGIGIPEASLLEIFRPFSQIDQDLSKAHSGTGLGLTIVARLMEALDGTIEIDSEVDAGTTIKLRFSGDRIVEPDGKAVPA